MSKEIYLNEKFQFYTQATVSEICENINKLINVLESKLIPVFNNLDKETENIENKIYEEQTEYIYTFSDDYENIMEQEREAQIISQETAWEYYSMNKEIQQDFLNMTAVWLFHLFEKEKKEIFTFKFQENGKEKKKEFEKEELKWILETIQVNIKEDSNWKKINKELRALNNAIKHGEGSSFQKLKELRPDLLIDVNQKNSSEYSDIFYPEKLKITVTFEDTKKYAKAMKEFWQEYFYKTESYDKSRDSDYLINIGFLGKTCKEFQE